MLWLARKDQMAEGQRLGAAGQHAVLSPASAWSSPPAPSRPQSEPITDAEFKAEVVKPDKKPSPAVLIRKDEQMAGSFRETQTPGDYTIEVTATRKGEPLGTARARFLVSQQDLELDNASADLDSMKGVAKSSGGEVVEPERLPKWLAELMKKTDYLDVKQENEEDLVGPVAVLLGGGAAADGRVVLAEAVGAGVISPLRRRKTPQPPSFRPGSQ